MAWYVILVIGGYLCIVFLVNLKILFYYEHPDDSKYSQGFFAKITCLLGLQLAWLLLCALPTDAYNVKNNGGFNMEIFWDLVLFLTLCFLIFPIPFAASYYEADTDSRLTKSPAWLRSLTSALITFSLCAIVIAATYFALRSTSVPDASGITSLPGSDSIDASNLSMVDTYTPFFSYAAVLLSFFGWFPVLLYLGLGFSALPIGLIVGFIDRPRPISQDEYSNAKIMLGEQVSALKIIGEELRERDTQLKTVSKGFGKMKLKRAYKNDFNKFRQSVHLLQIEYEKLNICLKERGENPLISYFKLLCGIFGLVLSLAWVAHIIIYILLPQLIKTKINFGLLDSFMVLIAKLEAYILELIVYGILVGYLLCCVIVGCFRFNMRMFCCFSIHPMKKEGTHLNSILFNTAIIMVSTSAISQLGYMSFHEYAKGTQAELLYGSYVQNTVVLKVFFQNNIFVWLLIIWAITAAVILSIKPKDSQAFDINKLKKLRLNKKPVTGEGGPSGPEDALNTFGQDVEKKAGNFTSSMNVIGKLAF